MCYLWAPLSSYLLMKVGDPAEWHKPRALTSDSYPWELRFEFCEQL
jgi:hypothetical protein